MTTTTLPPKTMPVYPRPPIVRDHATLFVEAVYEDGQPYADPDDEEEAA
jgi:hypothetical protein